MSRGHRAALLFIVFAALLVRLYNLGWRDLWLDELFSYAFATYPRWQLFFPSTTLPHTPLFFFLISWIPPSAPDWVFRLPAAVCGWFTVVLTMTCLHRAGWRSEALWAGAWLAFHPLMVYWSREVRMYTLYGLIIVFMVLCEVIGRKGERWWGVGLAAAFFVFPYTLYYMPFFLWAAWCRRSWPGTVSWTAGLLAVLAWLVPAWWISRNSLGDSTFDILNLRMALSFIKQTLCGNYLSVGEPIVIPMHVSLVLGFAGLLLSLIHMVRIRAWWIGNLWLAALLPLALYAGAQHWIGAGFTCRAFFPSSVLLLILSAVGWAGLPFRGLRILAACLLLAAYAWVLVLYFNLDYPYNWASSRRSSVFRAGAGVVDALQEGDAIYCDRIATVMALPRYFPHRRASAVFEEAEFNRTLLGFEKGFFRDYFTAERIRVCRLAQIDSEAFFIVRMACLDDTAPLPMSHHDLKDAWTAAELRVEVYGPLDADSGARRFRPIARSK